MTHILIEWAALKTESCMYVIQIQVSACNQLTSPQSCFNQKEVWSNKVSAFSVARRPEQAAIQDRN